MSIKSELSSFAEDNSTTLNDLYTFDNYVVGNFNHVAYTIAKHVSENLGVVYSPVFIYGPIGVGKTHLIQAIGHSALSQGKVVIYTTIEQFTNDFTYHLRHQSMDLFRNKYRTCDVLLIDDIQDLTNKLQTQTEIIHTFSALHTAGKQIVLTSDMPPKMLNSLEDRLKSRCIEGFISDIGTPELKDKIAMIKKKCDIFQFSLGDDIIMDIASNIGDDIREIESFAINLNILKNLIHQTNMIDIIQRILKNFLNQPAK
jgi:chromosomal replication initiator protein